MNGFEELKARLKTPELLAPECLIDGRWISASASAISVENPSTGQIIAQVPKLGAAETDAAVDAAAAAFDSWKTLTAKVRADILMKMYHLLVEHSEDLGAILTAEQGKPLREGINEILFTASFFEWYAAEIRRAYGKVVPTPDPDKRFLVMRQPIGVVAIITPWNFPAGMMGRKLAPALAAGCSVVVKPASQTPLSAMAVAKIAEMAGVPAGVVNVITGSAAEIGPALIEHPKVSKVTFTGSTSVGRTLYEKSARGLKHVSLELGGNAPLIVFDDADIETAVESAIQSKFRNAGQTCVCANRVLVQSGIYDQFVARFAERTSQLKIGDGFDLETDLGPLVDRRAAAGVRDILQDAVAGGARILNDRPEFEDTSAFVAPAVLVDVTEGQRVCTEEIFGPIAPVLKFETETDAIRIANNTEYGLSAYFFTRDNARIWRVSEALDSGVMGVNTGLISTAEIPFGGMKHSGLGREGGEEGLDAFLQSKMVCIADVNSNPN
ncbi:NAD-dependent succinate-semialdehyde dehydrogenase [Shimia sp. R10_1]|uniref:NAD-dependent succinate-semialdehyde dehydrogenase n=1 Tax=Shimia sp. R10_1 TaxID=2821095 RepID=UPI001ADD25C2|nr:NAD-dependent succinate-semialdehyde dehydrogenase [Shimia sp. R10_1]MBO9474004.1 NAD-dependent succinate-semialdehyde dehydrogenase [Shimia sp. R10_1]